MQPITELWASLNQRDWDAALKCYWENPSVKRNLKIEEYMDKLNLDSIRNLDRHEWYEFLKKYFRWKFTDPRFLPTRLNDLAKNSLETLLSIKEKLFAFDPSDIRKGLEITTSKKGIKGLGPAGASGLLAVLFPKWFGTADTFVVKALCKIESLPERREVLAMIRLDPKNKEYVQLNEKDAGLLINIMRKKAIGLNALFGPVGWTPRMVDMILWAARDTKDARCLNRATS